MATKKTATKKPLAKKKAVKRAVAKKSAQKKVVKKKTVAKKAVTKRVVKKKVVAKKAVVKRAASKPQSLPFTPTQFSTPSSSSTSVFDFQSPLETRTSKPKPKIKVSSFLLIVGTFFVLAFAVLNVTNSDKNSAGLTNKEELTGAEMVLAPATDVYATYTSTGGVITWSEPEYAEGLTGYIVQAAYADSEFTTIATLDIEQSSLRLIKIDTPGYTAYRVVSVFEDDEVFSQESIIRGKYRTGS